MGGPGGLAPQSFEIFQSINPNLANLERSGPIRGWTYPSPLIGTCTTSVHGRPYVKKIGGGGAWALNYFTLAHDSQH